MSVKRIKTIGDMMQKEDPNDKTVKPIPSFLVELENRLDPDADLNLRFDKPADYEGMFRKELGFGSNDEMVVARNMLLEVKRLDELNEEYFIINSPFTNTFVIMNETKVLYSYKFPNLLSYSYMVDVLKWIVDQERYF